MEYNKPVALKIISAYFCALHQKMVIGPTFYLKIPLFAWKCPENEKFLVDRYASLMHGQAEGDIYTLTVREKVTSLQNIHPLNAWSSVAQCKIQTLPLA